MKKDKIISFLLPLLLFILLELMFYISDGLDGIVDIHWISFIFSIFLFYAIYCLIYSLTNNSKYTFLIVSITGYLIMVGSIIKIAFSLEPFYLTDLLYFNSGGEIFSIIEGSIWSTIKYLLILIFIAASIIPVGLNIFQFKHNYKLDNKIVRIVMFSVSLLFLIVLFIPNKGIDNFILNTFYEKDKQNDYDIPLVSNLGYYRYYGHLAGIYGNFIEGRVYPHDDYDVEEIAKVVNSSPTEEDKSLGKPNIIVVFSESFWDIDQVEEITFDKQVTPNFNRLKEEGLFFDMISPSYGGISANVEYEFMTGGSLNYFSNGYIPYMSLYTDNKENSPSIISELNKNDYYTKLVLYTSPNLFNCRNFYKSAQPDSVEYNRKIEDKYIKGKYVSEEHIVDSIINELDNKDKDEKLFYFTATMQAHMPYKLSKYDEYDIDIVDSNLDEELNNSIKSYAQGIYDADKQLGRLYDYIQTLDEDTIIIFYGDHLPYIKADGKDVLTELEFFNTDDDKLNLYRKYNTQALVLANYNMDTLKEENKEIKYLSPDLLSTYVLNHMDIELSNYFKWLYTTKDIIGASNKFISINQNGELYYTNQLKGDMKKLNDFRYNVQYKYFIEE